LFRWIIWNIKLEEYEIDDLEECLNGASEYYDKDFKESGISLISMEDVYWI